MLVKAVALLCVVGLAFGQILFKASAAALAQTGTLYSIKPAASFAAAIALYGVTSIAWVWVLQRAPLGKVYPLMALAFVFVPIASHFVFGERFNTQYFVGVGLILIGIVVAVRV